jgi:hypothetical protein
MSISQHDGVERDSPPVTGAITGGPTQPQHEIVSTHREPSALSTITAGPSTVPEVMTNMNPMMLMSMVSYFYCRVIYYFCLIVLMQPSLDHSNTNPTNTFFDFLAFSQTTMDIPAMTVTSTDHMPPCGVTLGPESLPTDKKKQAMAVGKDAEVDWLNAIVQKRPGWQAFINGMNHNQQNPTVAQSWRFAVAFAKEYNKTVSKGAVSSFYSHHSAE